MPRFGMRWSSTRAISHSGRARVGLSGRAGLKPHSIALPTLFDEIFRGFYDVTATRVEVLAIIAKDQTAEWLDKHGEKS